MLKKQWMNKKEAFIKNILGRTSHRRCSLIKLVLRNIAKFTEEHL